MCTLLVKLFVIYSVFMILNSVCDGYVQPKLKLPNGTILLDGEIIDIVYGDPLELYCSKEASDQELRMLTYKNGEAEELAATTVNETTIRFFIEKPERQHTYYYCEDTKSQLKTCAHAKIDSPPEARDFRCISKSPDSINCSWTTLNIKGTFSLYRDWDGETKLLCKLDNYQPLFCVWDSRHPLVPYERFFYRWLPFLMKSCNSLGCVDQKFEIDHFSIIKLNPPTNLILLSKSSHSAVLKWNIPDIRGVSGGDPDLEHKITYWYSGVYQHRVNSSSIKMYRYFWEYGVEIQLPCANTLYEVRVSIRRTVADRDEYWSDDAVLSFVTDPEPEGAEVEVDPTCNQPRVKITPDIMLYQIDKFREKVIQQQNELKERIRSLKLNAVGVNKR